MILHAFARTNYSYFMAKTFTLNTLSVAVIYFNRRQKLLPIDLDRHNKTFPVQSSSVLTSAIGAFPLSVTRTGTSLSIDLPSILAL